MRILFVRTPPYESVPGTRNGQGPGLGRAFCRLGHDFDYITFKKKKNEDRVLYEYNGNRVKYMPKQRIRIFRTGICPEICDTNFLNQYDIIISQEYYQIMTYLLSKKSSNVVMFSGPYHNMFHTLIMSNIYDFLFTKKINQNIQCKFVKSTLAKEFLEKKGYTNVYDVGVGVDTERFGDHVVMEPKTLEIVEFMKNHRCILFIGVLNKNKNFPFLLKIYERLLEKAPDIRFVIIGKSKQTTWGKLLGKKDESYARDLYKQSPKNVQEGIYFIERVENAQLKFIYPLAKTLLLPSKREIFGMVLLEAMYFGTPVVTSRHGGSSTLIPTDETGQVVEKFDAELWTEAIMKYLNHPDYAKQVGERTSELIREKYTWDKIAQRMLDVIEKQKE